MKIENPLQWLPQQPRTKRPQRARFGRRSPYLAGKYLADELQRLNAKSIIISTNLISKTNGSFYANQKIDDSGVVVYFKLKNKDKAMACDRWDKPEDNLWALFLSIKAIRGLERWGGSDFLDGLFTGFKALPSPENSIITKESYFSDVTNKEYLQLKYKKLIRQLHPDVENGSEEKFKEMIEQYNKIKIKLEVEK